MSAPLVIKDKDSGNSAKVTKYGQLVVSPVDYSTPVTATLSVINTAYSFISPVMDHSIVITDIILTANKNVGASDATVIVYEADDPGDLTATKEILNLEMIKQSNLPLIGLNMIVTEGRFVNAKTDDNDIFVTIMYYMVPVEE